MGLMRHVRGAEIGCKPIGLGEGTRGDVVLHEGAQRLGAIVRDRCKSHAPESQLTLLPAFDLGRAGDDELAGGAAYPTASGRMVLGTKANCGLADLGLTRP